MITLPDSISILLLGLVVSLGPSRLFADNPKPFGGSVAVMANQRFFYDDKLSNANQFPFWGAMDYEVTVGFLEFGHHIEPLLGFSYMRGSAPLYAINSDNTPIIVNGQKLKSSVDSLSYQFFTFEGGVRLKFWEPEYSVFIPFAELEGIYRFGRIQKQTYAVDQRNQQKVNTGFDFGADLGAGMLFSFFYDKISRAEWQSTYGLKDVALMTRIRFLPGGLIRRGLGGVSSTGGWDFGLGLFLNW